MLGIIETWHHLPTASGPRLFRTEGVEVWLKAMRNYGISKKIE